MPAGRVTNDTTNYFAFGLQSAVNVDATKFYFMKQLDGTGFDVKKDVSSERVGGVGREIGLRYPTKLTADGQYIQYCQSDFIGRVAYAALGGNDVVTAGPSSAALQLYTHTFGSGGSLLPYQTVEQNWADETERTGNCLISDLKIEGEAGKPVKATVQFISGGTPHATYAPLTPVRESNEVLMVPGGSVAITAVGALTAGAGGTSLELTKWSVEVKNTLDDNIQTTQLQREDVTWLNADYDFDGTAKYINNSLWNAVMYQGGSVVSPNLITTGAFNFYTQGPSGTSMSLFSPFLEFTALKVNRLDPDGKTMYLDYTASTRQIGTQSLQVVTNTTTASAYQNPLA